MGVGDWEILKKAKSMNKIVKLLIKRKKRNKCNYYRREKRKHKRRNKRKS